VKLHKLMRAGVESGKSVLPVCRPHRRYPPVALVSDKRASAEMATKIGRLVAHQSGTDTLPPDLRAFIEALPAGTREKLAEWNILNMARAAAGKSLMDHIADWRASLLAKGTTERHAELVTSRADEGIHGVQFQGVERHQRQQTASPPCHAPGGSGELQGPGQARHEQPDLQFLPASREAIRRAGW